MNARGLQGPATCPLDASGTHGQNSRSPRTLAFSEQRVIDTMFALGEQAANSATIHRLGSSRAKAGLGYLLDTRS
jgi:hypothetical protein